jgi:hypothetical protein
MRKRRYVKVWDVSPKPIDWLFIARQRYVWHVRESRKTKGTWKNRTMSFDEFLDSKIIF